MFRFSAFAILLFSPRVELLKEIDGAEICEMFEFNINRKLYRAGLLHSPAVYNNMLCSDIWQKFPFYTNL